MERPPAAIFKREESGRQNEICIISHTNCSSQKQREPQLDKDVIVRNLRAVVGDVQRATTVEVMVTEMIDGVLSTAGSAGEIAPSGIVSTVGIM